MPPQPTVTQIRLNNIATCLTMAANTLDILVGSLKSPFLEAIFHTTQSLLKKMETVKQNKNECTQLLEQTYELLDTILMVHITSDTGGELPPSVLKHIGKFTETLHKIHTFVEAQQNGNKLKNFFHQGEMSTLLKDCRAELQQGFEIFQVPMVNHMKDITQMQEDAEKRNKEVLDMIEALSDTTSSDGASSVWEFQSSLRESPHKFAQISRLYSGSHNRPVSSQLSIISFVSDIYSSSNSISMLPSQPKIFHGRDSELSNILQHFSQGTPRIAILGAGGMGKTSLAKAVIHHTEITERYNQHRFFVACDPAVTQVELAALIGAHVGLKPGKDLTHLVIQYFSSSSDCLLILDNLETLWEPVESRGKIEEFLSLLTGVDHLALLITMRGAERPAKVAWTHPFLPLLKPLEHAAAQQTFIDIADTTHDPNEVAEVLSLTDNLPLAINLMAHLVDSEGCSHVLSRWEEEKTSLISDGYDRTSNLDLSISLSLSSPRLNPHAKDLLSLLSMLPDGLSDAELVQSKLCIDNILSCKAALICTSLAYSDEHKRLKVLVPIREYMQKIHPPGDHLIRPLLKHFEELLEFYMEYQGNQSNFSTVVRISSNYSNIQSVLQNGLQQGHADLVNSIYYTLVSNALEHFKEFDEPDLKCRLYNVLITYYHMKGDISSATKFCGAAISLALSTGNTKWHSDGLCNLAWVEFSLGNYSVAQVYAIEAQRLAIISADLYGEAQALWIQATCSHIFGNYTKAMSLCIRARALLDLCGMSHGALDHDIMNTQAHIHQLKSEYVEAHSIHTRILEGTTIQNPYSYGLALLNVAETGVLIGAPKNDVHRNCDTARRILTTVGDVEGVTMCDVFLGDLHMREGNSSAAKIILVGCLKATLENSQIQTYCLERLADASCWGGLDGMSNWRTVFLVHSLKRTEKLGIYKALKFLGDVFLSQNDEQTAISLFTVALEGFTEMDVHCSRAECMFQLGDISMGHGDLLRAVEFWESAGPLFERSSQTNQVHCINERLAGISEDVLEQHTNNLTHLAEINAPAGTVEELEDDVSD
ncbi:hypothetical protein B0H13DRAFT_2490039 [Mycena leptocephala]|nr:hypothetical protein B0H13DRAFT_2490039 [Mycena leptocephala]